jgi:hypothetical protein
MARQNARSDRVCLDFSLVTFFVIATKKVTEKNNHELKFDLKIIDDDFAPKVNKLIKGKLIYSFTFVT